MEVPSWSYEGMHMVEDGDSLKVFHPEHGHVVWEGTVAYNEYPPFAETAHGRYIHNDPVDVPRETWALWFMKQYPAELRKKVK